QTARLGPVSPAGYLESDALQALKRLTSLDECGQQQVGESTVLEQQLAERLAFDRYVARPLGGHGGHENRLPGEQVELSEEPGVGVADDLVARAVADRDLTFEDRDEGIRLVADLVERLADLGGSLLAALGEHR